MAIARFTPLPLLLLACAGILHPPQSRGATPPADVRLIETEGFADIGGWSLDTQFIEEMGSPYLMAHGMGTPVKDATTALELPGAGDWHVWVRTKDWVAPWKVTGAPGKFQLLIDGKPLEPTFGTVGENWHWQPGGKVALTSTKIALTLKDLTGFNGRCDAIAFTRSATPPPAEGAALASWRLVSLGLPPNPEDAGTFDLVVVGGGYGGMGAAIGAARMGCKVALVQDRAVLGGNGSSEVRVWAMGGIRRGKYPMIGEIVEEFSDAAKLSPGTYEEFGDAKKEAVVRAEKNITLFLNHYATGVEKKKADAITAVIALDTRTNVRRRFAAKLFCDATGHAAVAALADAENTLREKEHLGMSNMWRWTMADGPVSFPEITWGLPLEMEDFPYPQRFHAQWFWESGFDKHPILQLESTRDWNFRAIFGAWNAMKNRGGKAEHLNAKLDWIAHVGGTRESRQVIGDVLLTREDISTKKEFPDGTVPTTWDIDLHYPREQYAKKFSDDPFISKAVFDKSVDRQHGYPVPYRCFYSKNVENLFTAGRCISVTHEALGTVRVMKTGGMIGEVVGKAASICIKNDCTPRAVYERYWKELDELLRLHGKARRDTVHSEIRLPEGFQPPAPEVTKKEGGHEGIAIRSLIGMAVDDSKAKLTGVWTEGHGLEPYVGTGYRYAGKDGKSSARYEFTVPESATYEVRLNFAPHENRATNTPVTVETAEGPKTFTVNQRKAPELPQSFHSLGLLRFDAGKPAVITIGGQPTDGNVHIDAVQLAPDPR